MTTLPSYCLQIYNVRLHIFDFKWLGFLHRIRWKYWVYLPPPAAVTTIWRRRSSISSHLNTELPSVQKSTIHSIQCIFCIPFVIKPEKIHVTNYTDSLWITSKQQQKNCKERLVLKVMLSIWPPLHAKRFTAFFSKGYALNQMHKFLNLYILTWQKQILCSHVKIYHGVCKYPLLRRISQKRDANPQALFDRSNYQPSRKPFPLYEAVVFRNSCLTSLVNRII